jgi:ATP-dependent RNA helicase RhlE
MSFETLGLTPELLRAVSAQGYTEPTPVQSESIPLVLAGRDLLAGAQTGTGKTAAFVLPILQLLHANRVEPRPLPPGQFRARGNSGMPIRCLVLTPTRELALQIEESVRTYGAQRPIRSTTIYGGVGFEPQARALRAGPEIVVATPGRLLDHAQQGTIDLRFVEILVLDEADRMLDMGFIRDIRRVLALLGTGPRQTLLFSATFSEEIRQLAAEFLKDPAHVQIARRNAPIELVRQVVYPVDRERKRDLLSFLIGSGRIDRALVFTRTKHGANRLAEQLVMDGIAATAIHGNKSQAQRVRALNDFKGGVAAVLVATEVAARGLDIEALPHVVNFELPMVASDYVHRIGRTGRAGMEGDAVSLVCVDEMGLLRDIEQLLRGPIAREVVAGFEVDPSIRPEPILQRTNGARPMRRPMGSPRSASPRPMAPRPEAPRQAPARPNFARPEMARAEAPRPMAPRAESPRPMAPRADSPRPMAPRPAAPRPDERSFSRPNRPQPGPGYAAPSRPAYGARPSGPAVVSYRNAGRPGPGRPVSGGRPVGGRPASGRPAGVPGTGFGHQAPAPRPSHSNSGPRHGHSSMPGERIARRDERAS